MARVRMEAVKVMPQTEMVCRGNFSHRRLGGFCVPRADSAKVVTSSQWCGTIGRDCNRVW